MYKSDIFDLRRDCPVTFFRLFNYHNMVFKVNLSFMSFDNEDIGRKTCVFSDLTLI